MILEVRVFNYVECIVPWTIRKNRIGAYENLRHACLIKKYTEGQTKINDATANSIVLRCDEAFVVRCDFLSVQL